jgi:peptide/nickel transport system substrate-binding protein
MAYSTQNIQFKQDTSSFRLAPTLHPKSHIKVFLPSIPYSYIAKNTNSGLIRSHDNKRGWVYDLAKSHERLDEYTYVFEIRKNLRFQDGSAFTIESVIKNLEYFKQSPFLYTNIDKIDFQVTQIGQYKVKMRLSQKYEMFLTDLARIYFYTDEYLDKYQPKGAQTGSANRVPGPFGMGPYILKSGYARGEKQTPKLELVANPYYWDKQYPKIQKVTVFTQLNTKEALDEVINHEGKLDITPIPFNKKIDVLLSRYAKLVIKESTNTFLIYFNLINGNHALKNKNVRIALNEALNQENLLNFVYKKEGKISPFSTSVNYDVVEKIALKKAFNNHRLSENEKKQLLNGLRLKVFTQDRFMFLWKGIEFQLKKYGVTLEYTITNSERDIYGQLLTTRSHQNSKEWDMLIWGDDDWYYQNPWTVFFIYENNSPWSTIKDDALLGSYIEEYFQTKVDTKAYENVVEKILCRARKQAYTLRVPSPNKVIAVNKEVLYEAYEGGMIPLWKIQITQDHWSVRGKKEYAEQLQHPIKTQRQSNEISQ